MEFSKKFKSLLKSSTSGGKKRKLLKFNDEWFCTSCNQSYLLKNRKRHEQTSSHLNSLRLEMTRNVENPLENYFEENDNDFIADPESLEGIDSLPQITQNDDNTDDENLDYPNLPPNEVDLDIQPHTLFENLNPHSKNLLSIFWYNKLTSRRLITQFLNVIKNVCLTPNFDFHSLPSSYKKVKALNDAIPKPRVNTNTVSSKTTSSSNKINERINRDVAYLNFVDIIAFIFKNPTLRSTIKLSKNELAPNETTPEFLQSPFFNFPLKFSRTMFFNYNEKNRMKEVCIGDLFYHKIKKYYGMVRNFDYDYNGSTEDDDEATFFQLLSHILYIEAPI